jgi:hypothetical protein
MDEHQSSLRSSRVERAPSRTAAPNTYVAAHALLATRGWCQGQDETRDGRLSLRRAVEVTIDGADQDGPAASLARRALLLNRLRELASTTNLDAWNDDASRTADDVTTLLLHASTLYPDD